MMNENEELDKDVLFDYLKDEVEVKLNWDEVLEQAFINIESFIEGFEKAIEALMDKRYEESRRFFIRTRELVAKELAKQFIDGHEVHGQAKELMDGVYARLVQRVFNKEGI